MFFKVFNRAKNKPFVSIIICVLLTFYIISSNGCQTTYTERYTSQNLKKKKQLSGISHILLKDGTYINTEDKLVFYYEKYADTSNVLIITAGDTVIAVNENGKHKLIAKPIEKIIPLSEVNEVYVSRTEFDTGKTLLLIGGVIVGLAVAYVVAVFIYLASHPIHSCPYIYSYDGFKYIYDAEPLGGVICEALTRIDLSRLEHLSPSDGKFKLFVRNENDEKQHLDEMKLLMVSHEEGLSVTPGMDNKFYKYKEIVPPISVTDENGKDITGYFKSKDDYRWQTGIDLMLNANKTKRHSLKFRFKKPEGVKNALLFFNGGITGWGSKMVKNTISLHGNKIDDWYNDLNKKGEELKSLHNYIINEELYYLKVNLLESNGYNVRAVIPGGGPKIDEDKVFNIPLENITGEFIEFNLNPPVGYWKFEQIGLIYDYETVKENEVSELDAAYGVDRSGNDVRKELLSTDNKYLEMPEIGNAFDLQFDVPDNYNKKTCEVFLKTNGWYEINTDKTKPEQKALLYDLMNTPGRIIDYSILLYKQSIKELTELKNKKSLNN